MTTETATDRYAVDHGQLTDNGRPILTLVRAAWGDDAPPAAELDALTAAIPAALNVADTLRGILWPPENIDAEWSADTLDAIAETMTRAGVGRPAACVDCVTNLEPIAIRSTVNGSNYCEDHAAAREVLAAIDAER